MSELIYSIEDISQSEWVLGYKKNGNYKVLEVQLPAEWDIPQKFFPETDNINVNTHDEAYIFYSDKASLSMIYKKLLDVVTYNQEKEKKLKIFNEHQATLQDYFDNLSLEEFDKVKIVYNATKKDKKDEPKLSIKP